MSAAMAAPARARAIDGQCDEVTDGKSVHVGLLEVLGQMDALRISTLYKRRDREIGCRGIRIYL
jgi:hypothetical protein